MFQIPYGLIPVVAMIWLTGEHARSSPASDRAKRGLVGIAALSVVLAHYLPLAGTLTQIAICLYVLVYRIITPGADRPSTP